MAFTQQPHDKHNLIQYNTH